MPDAEKPRVAKAAPAGRSASLSKRQWQDIRRARRLGADGLGGGLRVHGVEIFFPRPQNDVIQHAAKEGRSGQHGGAQRDDSLHAASRPDSRRRTGTTPTRNARQQRQHHRLLVFQKAVRHRLSSIFHAWAEAARAGGREQQRGERRQPATLSSGSSPQERALMCPATSMDDERAPKRGHLSPADGTAAAKGPSTPTRAAGGASSAGETPPQPKRPRNLLPPSIADAEEQALREASETLAANRRA